MHIAMCSYSGKGKSLLAAMKKGRTAVRRYEEARQAARYEDDKQSGRIAIRPYREKQYPLCPPKPSLEGNWRRVRYEDGHD